ncbi:hypothetical protein G6F21_013199 [Rhizopus arrhizus]|nr:hypothetical protein G6F24_013777 [Rhizopus arrhizus]KAG0777890.1 hypothetical protein G6F21_013199 [Rhizopus arrhizus]KAG0897509.1 hypothetical protein G6F33_013431 [Rhizopus arrhizus]KAG0926141.1 hypothetical protein G6F32_013317 [Rhizopus arrhizus]KAG1088565.1 hypothetical protein G6F40_013477 [Rhizopus arrhizus]
MELETGEEFAPGAFTSDSETEDDKADKDISDCTKTPTHSSQRVRFTVQQMSESIHTDRYNKKTIFHKLPTPPILRHTFQEIHASANEL